MKPSVQWFLCVSDRVYRLLLVAFPPAFRHSYGPYMAQTFRDCCRDTVRRDGMVGLLRLWGNMLCDLVPNAFLERCVALQRLCRHPWLYLIAFACGIFIGCVDLHHEYGPVAALLLLLVSFLFGVLQSQAVWRWALLLSGGIPLVHSFALLTNYPSPYRTDLLAATILPLLCASVSAYSGAMMRRLVTAFLYYRRSYVHL
jgi:hypothetical protein